MKLTDWFMNAVRNFIAPKDAFGRKVIFKRPVKMSPENIALFAAIQAQDLEAVQDALNKGASASAINQIFQPALCVAIAQAAEHSRKNSAPLDISIPVELINRGADVTARLGSYSAMAPLISFQTSHNAPVMELAELLLRKNITLRPMDFVMAERIPDKRNEFLYQHLIAYVKEKRGPGAQP